VIGQLAALSFLYRKTLGRPELVSFVSYPKRHKPLPTVLSLEEVGALIQAIRVARYQAVVMVLYGAGLRIAEALALHVSDIDGARGVLRVRHGKGRITRKRERLRPRPRPQRSHAATRTSIPTTRFIGSTSAPGLWGDLAPRSWRDPPNARPGEA
jgi:integrase